MHCHLGQRPSSRELPEEKCKPSWEEPQVSVWSPKLSQSRARVSCCEPDCLDPSISLPDPEEPGQGFTGALRAAVPLLLTQSLRGSKTPSQQNQPAERKPTALTGLFHSLEPPARFHC